MSMKEGAEQEQHGNRRLSSTVGNISDYIILGLWFTQTFDGESPPDRQSTTVQLTQDFTGDAHFDCQVEKFMKCTGTIS